MHWADLPACHSLLTSTQTCSPVVHRLVPSSHTHCLLLSPHPPLSSIFAPVTVIIHLTGVWLRSCEWVRMAVIRGNPRGLVLIFASVFGQRLSIQSCSLAKMKLLAVSGDRTVPSATETHCTSFLLLWQHRLPTQLLLKWLFDQCLPLLAHNDYNAVLFANMHVNQVLVKQHTSTRCYTYLSSLSVVCV